MPAPRIHRAARSFTIGAAIVAIVIGATVLLGWALDLDRLTRFLPGLSPMKPNTAVACMLTGAALLARTSASTWVLVLGRTAAALAIAIGAANLSEDLFGWNLGIDEALLDASERTSHAPFPGRFAPATAIGLVLLGAATLLLDTERGVVVAQLLAVAATFDGVLALAGYTYDAPSLYQFAPYRSVALPTGLTMALLGVAILCARPDRGAAMSLFGTNRGAWMTRRILPLAVLGFLAFGWLKLTGERRGWFADAIGDGILVTSSAAILVVSIWMHAALTQRVETALVESEQRLRLATESAGMGLWFWDIDRDRMVWTPVCAELFDVDPDRRLSSEEVIALLHPDDREAARAFLGNGAVADDGERTVEGRVMRPDGSTRWLSARGRVFRDAAGRATRMLGVINDVTDKKRIEHDREALLESERAARTALERHLRLKDEFLATVSHELRTPLHAVIGWTHILRTQRHGEGCDKPLEVIERNARLLEQIISDLLDMSRIVVGKLRFSARPLDVVPVVQAAVEAIRPAAQAKGLRLSCRGTGTVVRGDADRLQQIMWNLLSNAVKFTPRGGHIDVAVDAGDTRVTIRVTDTGEGIPADFLPHVFDQFRQADASKTRKHGGLGLGLALVKELVELHGGTIHAESDGPGRGATMTVTLPVASVSDECPESGRADAPPESRIESALPSLHGVKVLVVDDEPDARDLIARLLREHDAEVRSVACAADALTSLEHDRPHVLVSDIGMPDMDGYALLQHARARGLDVPAVATTAFVRPEEQVRARDAGYRAHLPKPIQPARLITTVAELASVGRTRAPATQVA
ncbi:diguanylate cyclase/phosphodiesterase [Minicystis rosea]|nr:diguanylate cyclase/phosphodiesterase [Minicystis rosea]